ncbi:MAG TPA: discoidin domain-containing protein [Sedimentisphaerales bacterium]|nr:discoidin domain-containing protein [Sedimentisphaerales bacterium]HRS11591.1 discoidin domain-containing protein [Sedimentisphaerales bacterium]HRV48254.1 discoidin domain-containing protein [Sedimentisphaerales bacterium]
MGKKSLLILLVAALTVLSSGTAYGRFDPAKDPALLGWWSFDEGSGTIAADGSGNGNDGTLNGDPLWVAGMYGTALQFDGQNAYVGTGKSLLNGLTGFTMAGWVSAGNTGVYSSLFGQNDLIEFGFTTENGGQLGTWMAGNGWAFVGANYGFSYPSWHHLVLAGDQTRIVIYIDGQEQASDEGGMSSGTSSYFFSIGGNVFNATGDWFRGEIDDVWLFSRALTEAEIRVLMKGPGGPGLATGPRPADEAVDVPRDVVLSWTPGEYAATHDIYFGTTFDDVNQASRSNPSGVLVSQDQAATVFDPAELLNFGQTYYWRIDEVNAPPDSTILKGNIWSFTTEPFAYPAQNIIATTNGTSDDGAGPENTVNGSGLNADDRHSIEATDMWLATPTAEDALWIQFEFERVLKLHELHVWNYNVQFEKALGFGIKNATIEYSTDGAAWTALGDFEFAQATARSGYASNTTIDLAGVAARYIRLIVNSGFGPMGQYGLSEVRFTCIPVQPREPKPADGATGIAPDVALTWRAGREASTHEVHLGTAPEAMTLAGTVATAGFAPTSLEFGSTYYWQIVEVNNAETTPSWTGDLWSFSTQEYAVIDDFEHYTDNLDAGAAIFDTWIDGWVNNSGSTVGYFEAPFAEQRIVHAGRQSMPLQYDNARAPWFSEAQRTWDIPQDWTVHGANTLVLYVQGRAPAFLETADGQILMNAIGSDIWNSADEFRFAHKRLSGNGSVVARVDSVLNSNAWAKAGVMIREGLEAGSKHAMVVVTPGSGISFQRRPAANAASENSDAAGLAAPYWVKLTRTGNVFTAQRSADGVTWVDIAVSAPVNIPMATDVYIGLALTSHDTAISTGAEFSNVSMTGNITGSWQIAEIGMAQPEGNSAEPLYVTVEDHAGKVKMIRHADPIATARPGWREWRIPQRDLESAGLKVNSIRAVSIGVGDRENPIAGGSGLVFVDDIGFGKPAATD